LALRFMETSLAGSPPPEPAAAAESLNYGSI
jgi:hypothetical protein